MAQLILRTTPGHSSDTNQDTSDIGLRTTRTSPFRECPFVRTVRPSRVRNYLTRPRNKGRGVFESQNPIKWGPLLSLIFANRCPGSTREGKITHANDT